MDEGSESKPVISMPEKTQAKPHLKRSASLEVQDGGWEDELEEKKFQAFFGGQFKGTTGEFFVKPEWRIELEKELRVVVVFFWDFALGAAGWHVYDHHRPGSARSSSFVTKDWRHGVVSWGPILWIPLIGWSPRSWIPLALSRNQ